MRVAYSTACSCSVPVARDAYARDGSVCVSPEREPPPAPPLPACALRRSACGCGAGGTAASCHTDRRPPPAPYGAWAGAACGAGGGDRHGDRRGAARAPVPRWSRAHAVRPQLNSTELVFERGCTALSNPRGETRHAHTFKRAYCTGHALAMRMVDGGWWMPDGQSSPSRGAGSADVARVRVPTHTTSGMRAHASDSTHSSEPWS